LARNYNPSRATNAHLITGKGNTETVNIHEFLNTISDEDEEKKDAINIDDFLKESEESSDLDNLDDHNSNYNHSIREGNHTANATPKNNNKTSALGSFDKAADKAAAKRRQSMINPKGLLITQNYDTSRGSAASGSKMSSQALFNKVE
jgi:hypothetical protein